MRPWLINTAAYIPIVVFGVDTKSVFKVEAVERKLAHAKLIQQGQMTDLSGLI
jgi:hypothetical protein